MSIETDLRLVTEGLKTALEQSKAETAVAAAANQLAKVEAKLAEQGPVAGVEQVG